MRFERDSIEAKIISKMTRIETAVQILTDLVAFPVLGGESNLSIAAYICNLLEKNGIEYHLVKNESGDKTSIHCRIGPETDGGVILSGHTDVVPVKGQAWDTDPFALTLKGDKLYGRGSCDMKGFLACCLASIELFQQADLKRPVYFAFSYDEEIGCLAAPALAAAINAHYTEKPKYAIIGEPSRMQPIVGQKGICVLETTVHGSAGHSSRVKQEVSAIHVAARLITWLEQKMDALIAAGHTDDRFHPNHSSLHSGIIGGGIAPNVIADKCSFHWDVRSIPADRIEDIIQDFEAYSRTLETALQQRFAGARIETVVHHPPVPSLDTPEDSSVVPLIRRLSGVEQLATVAYAAEAGQFAEAGFEAVICGPGDIAQAHRANEFIEMAQLELGLEMMERLARELAE
jgi:acetylornithine deacetylase